MARPNFLLRLWNRLSPLPLGRQTFSSLTGVRVPYFRSISPVMQALEPGLAIATMKKRWRVTNHLGTVHAIAMCNLAEFTGGLMAEASVPADTHRWIPKGMAVEYRQKATTDLRAVCRSQPLPEFGAEGFDWPMPVEVTDTAGTVVFTALITMWISPKPAR